MESKVTIIMQEMLPLLNNEQLLALRESLEHHLVDGKKQQKYSNNNLLKLFITAKQVEGCSSKQFVITRGRLKTCLMVLRSL